MQELYQLVLIILALGPVAPLTGQSAQASASPEEPIPGSLRFAALGSTSFYPKAPPKKKGKTKGLGYLKTRFLGMNPLFLVVFEALSVLLIYSLLVCCSPMILPEDMWRFANLLHLQRLPSRPPRVDLHKCRVPRQKPKP